MKNSYFIKLIIMFSFISLYSCTPMKKSNLSIDISPYFNNISLNSTTEISNDEMISVIQRVSQKYGLEECKRLEKIEGSITGFCKEWQDGGDSKLVDPTHPWIFDLVLLKSPENPKIFIIEIKEYRNLYKSQFLKEFQTTLLLELQNAYPKAIITQK